MASVVINGDTSGSVSVTVPATAGSNTITLPAVTGTAVIAGKNSAITAGTAVSNPTSPASSSIDFTNIPSWVKRITVMFYNVSTNGTSNIQVRLGTGGSPTTSGYQGTSLASTAAGNSASNSTTGFVLLSGSAAALCNGIGVFTNLTGNTWSGTISVGNSDTARLLTTSAGIILSGTLDIIRITTVNGTDTFDNGSINILYE
jgi:hypothetical protein